METIIQVTIFGATGFIGSYVLDSCIQAGFQVTAVCRSDEAAERILNRKIDIRVIDFSDSREISGVIKRNSIVYNCTATTSRNGRVKEYHPVEIELTERLLDAAVRAGAAHFVQLSSIIAYGLKHPFRIIQEQSPRYPRLPGSRASDQREALVREYCARHALPFTIIQPVSVIGARDDHSFFHRILKSYNQGRFTVIGEGNHTISLIDARDVGKMMADIGRDPDKFKNETFLLKGEDISWLEIKHHLDTYSSRQVKIRRIPKTIAKIIALLSEKIFHSSAFNTAIVSFLSETRVFDDAKIRERGVGPEYGIQKTIESLFAADRSEK